MFKNMKQGKHEKKLLTNDDDDSEMLKVQTLREPLSESNNGSKSKM